MKKFSVNKFIKNLDFIKMKGLIPTVIKDEQGNVLMLAYSNKESLRKTIETGYCWYFSRERKKLWMKGEISGNMQKLIEVKFDCDNDALLFIVKQKINACHLNRYSCFGERRNFSLMDLYKIIEKRIESKDRESYSYNLYTNSKLLNRKILEEANELVNTKNKKQVVWESSDLLYFVLVFLVKRRVKLGDVENKLAERNIIKLRKLIKIKSMRGQNGRF